MKKDLSIIILSFNTKKITKDCLDALTKNLKKSKLNTEVIVIDNDSHDGSDAMLNKLNKKPGANIELQIILNKENVGYPKGNNQGVKVSSGKYILLLNSDVLVKKIDFDELLKFMDKNTSVGVLTVKVVLPSGKIDPASHRGFPTVWNSVCYFLKLEKIFGKMPILGKIFGGYHLTYLDLGKMHPVDAPSGAFYLTRRSIMDITKGFDENFFMYGEDLDLSMRIKKMGYKILYFPKFEVLHLKYQSGLKSKDPEIKKKVKKHFIESMRIFYRKHYEKSNPTFINNLVYLFIDIKKKLS